MKNLFSYFIENYEAITRAFITPDQTWEIRYVQTELIYYNIKMFRKYSLIKWTHIHTYDDAIIITGEATYNTSQLEYTLLEVHDLIIFTT